MTTLTCDEVISEHVRYLGSQFSCYQDGERLWIVSPFAHPDRDLIEVTVRSAHDRIHISDLGETLRHLAGMGFDPLATPKSAYLIDEILKDHGAELRRGVITKTAATEEIGETLQDVLAACLAVAHLVFLSRGSRPASFEEEVAQYLTEHGLKIEVNHKEEGRTGKPYTVDFYSKNGSSEALITALAASNTAATTPKINATFRLWSDLNNSRWRSSVLDDRTVKWRAQDVALLKNVSDVYYWSERDDYFANDLDNFARRALASRDVDVSPLHEAAVEAEKAELVAAPDIRLPGRKLPDRERKPRGIVPQANMPALPERSRRPRTRSKPPETPPQAS